MPRRRTVSSITSRWTTSQLATPGFLTTRIASPTISPWSADDCLLWEPPQTPMLLELDFPSAQFDNELLDMPLSGGDDLCSEAAIQSPSSILGSLEPNNSDHGFANPMTIPSGGLIATADFSQSSLYGLPVLISRCVPETTLQSTTAFFKTLETVLCGPRSPATAEQHLAGWSSDEKATIRRWCDGEVLPLR